MTTIYFTHLSKKPINSIHDEKPCKSNNSALKPKGLWFSKNNEWEEFCIGAGWTNNYEYELEIDFDNFLIIDTIEKLEQLIEKYYNPKTTCIKWNLIVKKYNGIYFNNYHSILNYVRSKSIFDLKYIWFYSVDVNSGCIFKASSTNIKSCKKIES